MIVEEAGLPEGGQLDRLLLCGVAGHCHEQHGGPARLGVLHGRHGVARIWSARHMARCNHRRRIKTEE